MPSKHFTNSSATVAFVAATQSVMVTAFAVSWALVHAALPVDAGSQVLLLAWAAVPPQV